jgi:leucyl aminopeptidase
MPRAVLVAKDFDPVPSMARTLGVRLEAAAEVPDGAHAVAVPVALDGELDPIIGLRRDALRAAGMNGKVGEALVLPSADGPLRVVVGVGASDAVSPTTVRDAAAAFASATVRHTDLAVIIGAGTAVEAEAVAQAVVEGILLTRYRYDPLVTGDKDPSVASITLVAPADQHEGALAGAERGRTFALAGGLSRDLANGPPAHLTATRLGEIAQALGAARGFGVEVFDRDQLVEMGCGGLIGVNGGSVEEPRMIKLTYRPDGASAHVSLVGKGIMYDSGGISLKPADGTHATMKNDMTGAGSVLSAFTVLAELGCRTAATGYLMCTDNMPSGTALKMGDVLTTRGGKTVEVMNTDAEGRLVMSDALVLSTEEPTDAIVSIATLTGAALRALGIEVAAILGTDQDLVDQLRAAGDVVDEPVWQLPMVEKYKAEIKSPIADIRNLGGPNAGSITAALFLAEFVGDRPFAHIDIAGTAEFPAASTWRTAGCTGFGARLLVEALLDFAKP